MVPADSATFFGLEDGAAVIEEYSGGLVPGLLQVPEYVRAMIGCAPGVDPATVERRVELRLRRQQILDRPTPMQLHVLIDASVLVDTVGGPDAARRQLAHLADVAERATVTLQVLGSGAGAHPGKGGRFSTLRFPDAADKQVVYLEHDHTNTFLENATDCEYYSLAFAEISRLAHSADESRTLLGETLRNLEWEVTH